MFDALGWLQFGGEDIWQKCNFSIVGFLYSLYRFFLSVHFTLNNDISNGRQDHTHTYTHTSPYSYLCVDFYRHPPTTLSPTPSLTSTSLPCLNFQSVLLMLWAPKIASICKNVLTLQVEWEFWYSICSKYKVTHVHTEAALNGNHIIMCSIQQFKHKMSAGLCRFLLCCGFNSSTEDTVNFPSLSHL